MNADELDADQLAAVNTKGSTLVEAGAGAGKTRTLVAKACYETSKADRKVYVMTFTVSAAEEINRRLSEAPPQRMPIQHVGTLHSFCLWLVRWAGNREELVDDTALDIVQADVAKRLRLRIAQKRMRKLAAGDDPDDAQERAFVGAYRKTLIENGLLSYDGILHTALTILSANTAPNWKGAIFLIDEAQDSSADDLAIYEALMARGAELWMVGDLQQAIFSFRHPIAVNVWHWWQQLKGEVLELATNYRSSQAVVHALNVINREFVPRLEARLPEGTVPGETTLLRADTEAEVYVQIRTRIVKLQAKYGFKSDEFAVLCRTNRECGQVATMLEGLAISVKQKDPSRSEHVPERLWAAFGFYRQPASDWMACRYLRSIGADDKAEQKAAAKAMKPVGYRIYPALFALERTKEHWPKWMDLLLVPKPEQAWFYERMPEGWPVLTWDEVVMRLFEAPLAEERGEGVTVTTVHSAKGREWRHVLMPFCDQQSYRPRNGAEEERVFFVGASRAIETLTFLYSTTRVDEYKGGMIDVAMCGALERIVDAGKAFKEKEKRRTPKQ